jgi:hypothetical protein
MAGYGTAGLGEVRSGKAGMVWLGMDRRCGVRQGRHGEAWLA